MMRVTIARLRWHETGLKLYLHEWRRILLLSVQSNQVLCMLDHTTLENYTELKD